MVAVRAIIDGLVFQGDATLTILEAAAQIGIEIPTLCYAPELKPLGVCRICVVELEGRPTLQAACHTPIADGMVIHTRSQRVLQARKVIVELMLAAHTGQCVSDVHSSECGLHQIASDLEVGPPRFRVRRRRNHPVENANAIINRDMSKCIMCRRCVAACSEIAKRSILNVANRGFASKIVVENDRNLNEKDCLDCGVCIDFCPTGALYRPGEEADRNV